MLIRENTLTCEVFVIVSELEKKCDQITVKMVFNALGGSRGYTTIKTVLDRMCDLGQLTSTPPNNRNKAKTYKTIKSLQDIRQENLRLMCSKLFNSDWGLVEEYIGDLKKVNPKPSNPSLIKGPIKRAKSLKRKNKPYYDRFQKKFVCGATVGEYYDYLLKSSEDRRREEKLKKELDKSIGIHKDGLIMIG